MADQISLNAGIRSNLMSLQNTSELLSRTEHRLSTGKDVNSPIDNAQNFFAARNLNDRASGLNQRLDAMGQSIQTLQSANNGIDTIRDMVDNMKALVNDALSRTDAEERREIGEQYNELLRQADTIAKDSIYAGTNLLQGNQILTVQFNEQFGESELDIQGVNIRGPENGPNTAGASEVGGSQEFGPIAASQASVATQGSIGSQSATPSVASSATVASQGSVAGQASEASQAALATQGSIGSQAGPPSVASQPSQASQASSGSQASIASIPSLASQATTASVGSQSGISFQPSIASQASQASQGSVSRAENYAFTLNVTTSEVGTSDVVGLKSHGLDRTGTGPGGTPERHNVDFGAANFQDTLGKLVVDLERMDEALSTESSRMTQNVTIVTLREEFTDNQISTLESGAEKLTLADMNEEGANLLALQTRHSLAIQSLSLSSQQSQQVLRLLG